MLVGSLKEPDVNEMVADVLDVPIQGEVAELTSSLFKKTLGNVFFCIQCLISLAQKGLLTSNLGTSEWSWDLNAVREGLTATETIADLMKEKLERSTAAKTISPLAACTGTTFEIWVLRELLHGIQAAENKTAKDLFAKILGSNVHEDVDKEKLTAIENDGGTGHNHDQALACERLSCVCARSVTC